MKLLAPINENQDVIDKNSIKDMVISSDDSVNDVVTVTSAQFDAMLIAGTLDPDTIYNVSDGDEHDKVVYNTVPVGTGVLWFGDLNTIPANFILPDGSLLSVNDYPDLFSLWGTKYGGDGVTTFGSPNLKGKVVVMLDPNDVDFDNVGETGGEKSHELLLTEIPSHVHTGTTDSDGGHSHQYFNSYNVATGGGANVTGDAGDGYGPWTTSNGAHTHSFTTNASGGDVNNSNATVSHNNVQPYIVAYYIIKAKRGIYTESLRRLDSEVAQMQRSLQIMEVNTVLPANQNFYTVHFNFPTGFSKTNTVLLAAQRGYHVGTSSETWVSLNEFLWTYQNQGSAIITTIHEYSFELGDTFDASYDGISMTVELRDPPTSDVSMTIRFALLKYL